MESLSTRRYFGYIGLLLSLITYLVWRKMTHKAPIYVSGQSILTAMIAIGGALLLGIRMCFSIVFGKMAIGILIGLIDSVVLSSLIPLTKGIKK